MRVRIQPVFTNMKRRDFLASALVGAGSMAVMPRPAAAAAVGRNLENVVFTESQPGHWGQGLGKLHVPEVTIKGSTMTVTTPHPMSEAHYIVSHTVVLEGGKFFDRQTFTYKDQPVSQHTLPSGYKGKVWVTSTCNLHDWWLKEVTA